jgi:hypothetical protein
LLSRRISLFLVFCTWREYWRSAAKEVFGVALVKISLVVGKFEAGDGYGCGYFYF